MGELVIVLGAEREDGFAINFRNVGFDDLCSASGGPFRPLSARLGLQQAYARTVAIGFRQQALWIMKRRPKVSAATAAFPESSLCYYFAIP